MKSPTEESYRKRILRVLVHIQVHLDDALPLEELARVAHFSPYHFHRVFRGLVGESVKEHIRRLRLERAAQRLMARRGPIAAIAFEAGYETHESFTRAFSAAFGASPSQFRAARRACVVEKAPSGVHFRPNGVPTRFRPVQTGAQSMDVRIENIPARRVAFMRHIGPYREVGETWGKLMSWAGSQGLLGPNTVALGVAHDDPDITPRDKLRYDACIAVDQSFTPEGGVGIQEIPGGDYAIVTHRGPYNTVNRTLARLCGEWLPTSGREARSAPCLGVFRNFPVNTPEADLLTDIYLPLE
jgi:AraC family transcriptional regulator